MATDKGVWNLQQVRDKQLQDLWSYSSSVNAFFVWGRNQFGELGQNSPAYAALSSPTQIPGSWSKIAGSSGSYNMGGIKSDGTLWGWGRNNYGQLGLNQPGNSHYSSPVQITSATNWSEVKLGGALSCLINTSGELFTMGFNNDGALGINVKAGSRSSPTQVPGTTWKQCTVNTYSMAATKTDGTLWTWGAAGHGQLGQNSRTYYSSPVQVPGTTWGIVDGCGTNGFLATKTDGTLWVWGRGPSGQLGLNDKVMKSSPTQIPGTWGTSINDISAGPGASGAINTSGELYMWGNGGPGQLAQNANTQYSSPKQVPGTTWSAIKIGGDTSFARKTDGTFWVWGENEQGKLGIDLPESSMRSSPVQVPGTDWSSAVCSQMMGAALKLL